MKKLQRHISLTTTLKGIGSPTLGQKPNPLVRELCLLEIGITFIGTK